MDNRVSPDTYFQSHLHSLMSDGTELDLDLPTGVFAKWSAQISECVEEIESHTANLDSEFVDGLLDVRYYCPTGCETVSRRMKRMYGDTFASAPCEDLMLKKFGYSSNSKYSSAEMLPRPDHWLDSSQHDPSQWAECNQNSDFSTNEEESTDTLQQMPSPTLQSVLYSRKQPVNILVQSARCLEEVMCCYLQVVNLILNCQSDGVAKLAVYTHLVSPPLPSGPSSPTACCT